METSDMDVRRLSISQARIIGHWLHLKFDRTLPMSHSSTPRPANTVPHLHAVRHDANQAHFLIPDRR